MTGLGPPGIVDSAINIKDWAGPVATVIAASAAALVAYRLGQSQINVAKAQADIARRNWETSNEKIVLELFERRLAIYEAIRAVIGDVTRSGTATDEVLHEYSKAIDRVSYFFGSEVQDYIESIRRLMIDLNLADTMMQNLHDPDRPKWIQKRQDKFLAVTKFYTDAPALFGPYLQAHQKIISQ